MSLHVQLSPQAIESLRRQRRNTTIFSILLSFVSIALLAVILGMFFLPSLIHETPTIVTYKPPVVEEQRLDNKRVTTTVRRKPSPPSTSINRFIAASAASPLSISVPEVDVTLPNMEFGDGEDFGSGWGNSKDFGTGASGGFGSSNPKTGGLRGYIYDLKQTRDRKTLGYSPSTFVVSAKNLIESRFSDSTFRDYYRGSTALYLTHLAIPDAPAEEGPLYFDADKEIRPSGWIAHYNGTVTVPQSGNYRFSGAGDDFLHVMINGRTVFNYFQTGETLDPKTKGYVPEQPSGRRVVPVNNAKWWVRYGEWIELKAGQQIELDIAVGETPGGRVGFLLQLEKKGVNYAHASEGHPILPLFTTKRFSAEDKKEIQGKFGSYKLDFENILVFSTKR